MADLLNSPLRESDEMDTDTRKRKQSELEAEQVEQEPQQKEAQQDKTDAVAQLPHSINARSRHLKKNDSEPYWRVEIQFEFLARLFLSHHRVFRNTFEEYDWPEFFKQIKTPTGQVIAHDQQFLNFFELYLLTLFKSNKISKVLKVRLMLDISFALNFAMLCFLVNVGRLNTTVNFDYEMRSQFRSFHSIPSLQVTDHFAIIDQYYPVECSRNFDEEESEKSKKKKLMVPTFDPNPSRPQFQPFKPLQDTPRIKSILKSINDLDVIPKTMSEFISATSNVYNRLNIVTVIFQMSNNEYEIMKCFYPPSIQPKLNTETNDRAYKSSGSLLNDIFLKPQLNSTEKVNRFLWMVYTFLETNLSITRMLHNPFNNPVYINAVAERVPHDVEFWQLLIQEEPEKDPTVNTILLLSPPMTFKMEGQMIEQYLNDYDTQQEVDYAEYMSKIRNDFLNEIPETTETPQSVDEQLVQANADNAAKRNITNSNTTAASATTTTTISNNNQEQTPSTLKFRLDHKKVTACDELDRYGPMDYILRGQGKTIFDTLEARALEPAVLVKYDDNNTLFESDGKKRKRTKKQINTQLSTELPMYLCVQSIEVMLNSQLKPGSINSKASILKRNKNKVIAQFIFDVIKSKFDQIGDKRRIMGNWQYLIEESNDLSFFLGQDIKTDDWGEFKVSILKALTRLHTTINGKMQIDHMLGGVYKSKKRAESLAFIDDAFSQLE